MRIAATAQLIGMSARSAVASSAFGPSLGLGAPTRSAVPARPRPRATIFSALRRSPATKKCARIAVHTGAIAPNTATSPDGTNCSAQKMSTHAVPMLNRPESAIAIRARTPLLSDDAAFPARDRDPRDGPRGMRLADAHRHRVHATAGGAGLHADRRHQRQADHAVGAAGQGGRALVPLHPLPRRLPAHRRAVPAGPAEAHPPPPPPPPVPRRVAPPP